MNNKKSNMEPAAPTLKRYYEVVDVEEDDTARSSLAIESNTKKFRGAGESERVDDSKDITQDENSTKLKDKTTGKVNGIEAFAKYQTKQTIGLRPIMGSNAYSHGDYWNERLRKLQQQKPNMDIYTKLPSLQPKVSELSAQPRSREMIILDNTEGDDGEVASIDRHTVQNVSNKASIPLINEDDTGTSINSSSSRKNIFNGCVFYINGRTETNMGSELSAFHLANAIRVNGGTVTVTLARSIVTHVIASNLSLQKNFQELSKSTGSKSHAKHIHIVKPAWVRESIQACRRLNERDYSIIADKTQSALKFG